MTKNDEMWAAVSERVHQAAKVGAEQMTMYLVTGARLAVMDGQFESPIEAVFYAWWEALKTPRGAGWAYLLPQQRVEIDGRAYRPDFTVDMDAHPGTYGSQVFTPYPKIAIELDGHEFHERTKEQVTERNQRDRALQGAGWKVLHVSGSELYRQPLVCVRDVMDIVSGDWAGFWERYWEDVRKQKDR